MTVSALRQRVAHQKRLDLIVASRQIRERERITVALGVNDGGLPGLHALDVDPKSWWSVEPEGQPRLGRRLLRGDDDQTAGHWTRHRCGKRHRELDLGADG